ncbi:MAG: ankyrin repeat domain-containing protein [Promethearchaeota archaeon]
MRQFSEAKKKKTMTIFDAARSGNLEFILRCLDSKSVKINDVDKVGNTMLNSALYEKQGRVIKFLLNHDDCDPNISNDIGYSPLHTIFSRKNGAYEFAEMLLNCPRLADGAMDKKTYYGFTVQGCVVDPDLLGLIKKFQLEKRTTNAITGEREKIQRDTKFAIDKLGQEERNIAAREVDIKRKMKILASKMNDMNTELEEMRKRGGEIEMEKELLLSGISEKIRKMEITVEDRMDREMILYMKKEEEKMEVIKKKAEEAVQRKKEEKREKMRVMNTIRMKKEKELRRINEEMGKMQLDMSICWKNDDK